MKASITHNKEQFTVNLLKPIDISIPLAADQNLLAWYIDPPKFEAVTDGVWIGKVSAGGDINFTTITFNPHAHGTHTETAGHIMEKVYSINEQLTTFFFMAEVITITPEAVGNQGGDFMISDTQIAPLLTGKSPEALIIRTLPNTYEKKTKNWSHTNWPYVEEKAMVRFRESGIKHLLIDLPSVDKEKDGGELKAHRAFWDVDGEPRLEATITEMIYVPYEVADGRYLLNLQIAPFENDASPSKPILYKIN